MPDKKQDITATELKEKNPQQICCSISDRSWLCRTAFSSGKGQSRFQGFRGGAES
jgi:hypothetical protein